MQRIRELRQEKGLSQVKLAVQADMDPATLNRLEQGKGNPNLRTLQRVADTLGVEVADLLGKAPAPSSQEKLFDNGVLVGQRRYSEPGLEASKRALEPLAIGIRALVETFGPIIDALPEPPLLEEYPRVRPLVEGAGPLNKTLTESGLVYDANELLAESKRGRPGAQELGQKVRAFHTALLELNELAERAQEWGRRVPEIAEARERGLSDEDIERELRDLVAQRQGAEDAP